MISKVTLQPAFILHSRPFRDTSLIIDLFTQQFGRINVIARGVRSAKSRVRGLLQPFVPLLISWSGKSDLPTLSKVEAAGGGYFISGKNLLSGFYLNELLIRLLHSHDPHPQAYNAYNLALTELQNNTATEVVLRRFEKHLLQDMGYGLELAIDVDNNQVVADGYYYFGFGSRLQRVRSEQMNDANVFVGKSLLALLHDDFSSSHELHDAKRLMRLVFDELLRGRPLKSRELYL
jgi:DNA repair protein RecO (recombination protein O)